MGRAAVRGAQTELQTVEGGDEDEGKATIPGAMELPAAVLDGIRTWLSSTLAQDHWQEVNASVKDDLGKALRETAEQGLTNDEAAERVRLALGEAGETRARLVARTEITGALNAGHAASRADLAARGLVTGQRWLCIVDDDTRPEHRAANGQRVNVGADFTVGGERCSFPGDQRLSAAQRCNCRCAVVSITPLDDDD